jgi:hypothetical protein
MEKLSGAKPIENLPVSATPWQITTFRGDLIAVSETEGAFLIKDGRAERMTPAEEVIDALENLVIGVGMGWDLEGMAEKGQDALKKVRQE